MSSIVEFINDFSDIIPDRLFDFVILYIVLFYYFSSQFYKSINVERDHNNTQILLYERKINNLKEKVKIYKNCAEANKCLSEAEYKKKIADLSRDNFEARVLTEEVQNKKIKVDLVLAELKEERKKNIETILKLEEDMETMRYELEEQSEKNREIESNCKEYQTKIERVQDILNSEERAAKKIPLIQHIIYKEEQYSEEEKEESDCDSEYEE